MKADAPMRYLLLLAIILPALAGQAPAPAAGQPKPEEAKPAAEPGQAAQAEPAADSPSPDVERNFTGSVDIG